MPLRQRQVVPYTVTLAETRPYTRVYTSPPTGYAELAGPLFPLADEKRGGAGWRQSSMAALDDMPPRDRTSGSSTALRESDTGNTALPAIAQDLHVPAAQSIWIVNIFQLATVSSLFTFAALGHKPATVLRNL